MRKKLKKINLKKGKSNLKKRYEINSFSRRNKKISRRKNPLVRIKLNLPESNYFGFLRGDYEYDEKYERDIIDYVLDNFTPETRLRALLYFGNKNSILETSEKNTFDKSVNLAEKFVNDSNLSKPDAQLFLRGYDEFIDNLENNLNITKAFIISFLNSSSNLVEKILDSEVNLVKEIKVLNQWYFEDEGRFHDIYT